MEIVEVNAYKDHIHMLVCISLRMSVVQFIGFMKEKSILLFFDRHANFKYMYGYRYFDVEDIRY